MVMKILNSAQIKQLDEVTIAHEPIASIDLMERACRAFVSWFVEHFDASSKVGIVCGTGNNGGDGLGIARMLHEWNYPVKVWIVRGSVKQSDDFSTNLKRLDGLLPVNEIVDSISDHEKSECRWVTKEELKNMDLRPNVLFYAEEALKELGEN